MAYLRRLWALDSFATVKYGNIKKALYRQVVNVMLDSVTRCRCRDFSPKIEKILKIVLFRPVRDRL